MNKAVEQERERDGPMRKLLIGELGEQPMEIEARGWVLSGLETEVGSQGVTGRFRKARQAVGVPRVGS